MGGWASFQGLRTFSLQRKSQGFGLEGKYAGFCLESGGSFFGSANGQAVFFFQNQYKTSKPSTIVNEYASFTPQLRSQSQKKPVCWFGGRNAQPLSTTPKLGCQESFSAPCFLLLGLTIAPSPSPTIASPQLLAPGWQVQPSPSV